MEADVVREAKAIAGALTLAQRHAVMRGYDDGQSTPTLLALGLIVDDRGPGRPNRYAETALGAAVRAVLEAEGREG
jgi:hypothetical protein